MLQRSHMWIQTGVTVRKRLNWVLTSVTLTFDLWAQPLAWTTLLSMVITPENFMMIRWQEHSEKGMTDRQTDRQTDRGVLRAAWSQLKNGYGFGEKSGHHAKWIGVNDKGFKIFYRLLLSHTLVRAGTEHESGLESFSQTFSTGFTSFLFYMLVGGMFRCSVFQEAWRSDKLSWNTLHLNIPPTSM